MENKKHKRTPWGERDKKYLKELEKEYLWYSEVAGKNNENVIDMKKQLEILKKWDKLSDEGASLDDLSDKDYEIFGHARKYMSD